MGRLLLQLAGQQPALPEEVQLLQQLLGDAAGKAADASGTVQLALASLRVLADLKGGGQLAQLARRLWWTSWRRRAASA
jgi:hypothetical protein